MTEPGPHLGSKVRRFAVLQTPGLTFGYKQFAAKALDPLQREGWVTVVRQTQTAAGGNSVVIVPTQQFADTLAEPLLDAVVNHVHRQNPISLRKPLKQLLDIVDNTSLTNHARGLALEGVCIQVVRVLVLDSFGGGYAVIKRMGRGSTLSPRRSARRTKSLRFRAKHP